MSGQQLALATNTPEFLRDLLVIVQRCYPSDYNGYSFRGKL